MTDATTTDTAGMWCDDFDADLLAVVPGAVTALGPAAQLELHTYNHRPTNGKINCPAAWHTDFGLAAFFSTRDRDPVPAHFYVGGLELVACTFLEVVRDEWVHGQAVVVNGHVVWEPPSDVMYALMADLRGWTSLEAADLAAKQSQVRMSLTEAAARTLGIVRATT